MKRTEMNPYEGSVQCTYLRLDHHSLFAQLQMHIMYIDESGDTVEPSNGGKRFLVLTGCIIHEDARITMEQSFRELKQRYYRNPDIEFKSNFLRYANPQLAEFSPLKLHDRGRYDDLEAEVAQFLTLQPVHLYAVAIDKRLFWEMYPSQSPYAYAYAFLIERFQFFLQDERSLGIHHSRSPRGTS